MRANRGFLFLKSFVDHERFIPKKTRAETERVPAPDLLDHARAGCAGGDLVAAVSVKDRDARHDARRPAHFDVADFSAAHIHDLGADRQGRIQGPKVRFARHGLADSWLAGATNRGNDIVRVHRDPDAGVAHIIDGDLDLLRLRRQCHLRQDCERQNGRADGA